MEHCASSDSFAKLRRLILKVQGICSIFKEHCELSKQNGQSAEAKSSAFLFRLALKLLESLHDVSKQYLLTDIPPEELECMLSRILSNKLELLEHSLEELGKTEELAARDSKSKLQRSLFVSGEQLFLMECREKFTPSCSKIPIQRRGVPQGHTAFSWAPGAARASPAGHTAFSWGNEAQSSAALHHYDCFGLLCLITCELRAKEATEEFQRQICKAQVELGASTDYSSDNFTFGTTSFKGWWQLNNVPQLIELISSGAPYVVFGSSSGLLCFFGALAWQTETFGYELMPHLVMLAKETAFAYKMKNVSFSCQDMLTATFPSRCCILMLTSLCWDEFLALKVAEKVFHELPKGSIVIDYRESFCNCEKLAYITKINISASWSDEQQLFLYVKTH